MIIKNSLLWLLGSVFFLASCGGGRSSPAVPTMPGPGAPLATDPPLAAPSNNSLPNYDSAVAQLLNNVTSQPTTNGGGQIVWNTRYYMESLITAYAATGNQKYIDSLIATGSAVLNDLQTLTVLNIVDPSAPGPPQSGPQISVTGWPTYLSMFAQPVTVPTTDGHIALYAQVLRPGNGPTDLGVAMSPSGGVVLNWERFGTVMQSIQVSSQQDLNALAGPPLDYFSSLYRVNVTGQGLPAPGDYVMDNALPTVWHGEQTGGILLPFVRFLLVAKQRPSVADPVMVSEWAQQVEAIAGSYEDQLVSDGKGGLVITNPIWMPGTEAGLPSPSDYINAEIRMRVLLYELTGNSHELSLAQGLLAHENTNLQASAQGWVLLKGWPDIQSWSTISQAPYGSIYSSLVYNNSGPTSSGEGAFFVDMLQAAADYGLTSQLGISAQVYQEQKQTFSQYIRVPYSGTQPLVRPGYPSATSLASDPVEPGADPFVAAGYLAPINADSSFVCDNWKWMQNNAAAAQQGEPVGYALRAWARSEAARLALAPGTCPTQ